MEASNLNTLILRENRYFPTCMKPVGSGEPKTLRSTSNELSKEPDNESNSNTTSWFKIEPQMLSLYLSQLNQWQ